MRFSHYYVYWYLLQHTNFLNIYCTYPQPCLPSFYFEGGGAYRYIILLSFIDPTLLNMCTLFFPQILSIKSRSVVIRKRKQRRRWSPRSTRFVRSGPLFSRYKRPKRYRQYLRYTRNKYVLSSRVFKVKHKSFFWTLKHSMRLLVSGVGLESMSPASALYFQLNKNSQVNLQVTQVFADYIYALQFYFMRIFSINFSLSMFNTYDLIPETCRVVGTRFLLLTTPRKLRLYYFTELSDIFLSALVTKNLCFLVRWIKHQIEKRSIKVFSLMRRFIRKIFKGLFWGLRSLTGLLGFRLNFVGKLVKGGGKKKRIKYSRGQCSHNKKSLRIIYKSFYLRTISGIVGCFIELAY